MGGSKTVEKTESNGKQEITLPAWMSREGEGLYKDAKGAAEASPIQAYTGPLGPELQQNQSQAINMASSGTGAGQPQLQFGQGMSAAGATGGVADVNAGEFNGAQAQKYMDPYRDQVQQRTLMEMMRQNGMAMDGIGDSAAASKAYGGTRHAVLEAETGKAQNANILDYLANSNSAAYGQAADLFERDRSARVNAEFGNNANQQAMYDRLMRGGRDMAGFGQQAQDMQSKDIMNLLATGGVAQDTEAAKRSADYGEFLRMQDAPLDRYRDLSGILSGTPRNVTTTSAETGTRTTSQPTNWLNAALGAGQIAAGAGLFSDPRLKTDVELVGALDNGLNVYRYSYIWDKTVKHVGVMADEVKRLIPDAVTTMFGFDAVDYSKIGAMA